MFGTFDGQFADSVVVDHLRNTAKWLAELSKDESTISIDDLHVHEATRTPATAPPGQHQHTTYTHPCQTTPPPTVALKYVHIVINLL